MDAAAAAGADARFSSIHLRSRQYKSRCSYFFPAFFGVIVKLKYDLYGFFFLLLAHQRRWNFFLVWLIISLLLHRAGRVGVVGAGIVAFPQMRGYLHVTSFDFFFSALFARKGFLLILRPTDLLPSHPLLFFWHLKLFVDPGFRNAICQEMSYK